MTFDPVYTLIITAAIGAGTILARRTQAELPLAPREKFFLGLGAFCGAMIGAKSPFVLSDWRGFLSGAAWFTDGKTILSGLAGGYLGVELAKWFLGVRVKTGDSFAVPVAVAVGMGRLGCYHAGCCYGTPTRLPWGVVFPHVDSLPRHPTQLYEALFHLGAALGIYVLFERGLLRGQLIKLYILSYAVYRFITEWIRPEARLAGGLTGYQWAALLLAALFAWLWMRDSRFHPAMKAASSGNPPLTDSAKHTGAVAWLRLLAAILLSLVILPYPWGRSVIGISVFGWPEPMFASVLAASVVAIMALTFHLGTQRPFLNRGKLLGIVLVTLWTAVVAGVVVVSSGNLVPRLYVAAAMVASSWLVLWVSWAFYAPWKGSQRAWIALLLACLAIPYWVLFRVEGLTGGAQVNFAWRDWRWGERASGDPQVTVETVGHDARVISSDHDYPQFLGPDRNGVLPHARLSRNWSAWPKEPLWRRPIGAGWSSFAVAGECAITQEQLGGEECTVCYRLHTGEPLWIHRDPARFESSMGGVGPRATPTIHAGRVYSLGAAGRLNCLDARTGQPLWSIVILDEAQQTYHGNAASPLVVDEWVLVCPTGAGGPSLAAYRGATGDLVWQAGNDRASYSSPLVTTIQGVRQVLLFNEEGVTAHELSAGRVLWNFPWTNNVKTSVSQPIPHAGARDQIFISSGYDAGCALFCVHRSDDDVWATRTLWSNARMKTKFCTAVVHRDHVYGLDNGILACLELNTGRQTWKQGRYGHGQILLAGDLLVIQAESGDLHLVELNPRQRIELGKLPAIQGKTWNNPALAGAYLLVRNSEEAACYRVPLDGE